MDNQIGTGVFDSLVGRLLNMGQQQGGIIAAVSPELSATLVLENDRPEWCFLKNERCCAGMADVAANAGQVSRVRFRNPTNSGCLAVVEAIGLSFFVATLNYAAIYIGSNAADLGTAENKNVQRDTRTGSQKGACILSSDNTGVGANNGVQFELVSTSIGNITFTALPVVLAPGGTLDINCGIPNVETVFAFRWREREQRNYEK
jgi:hypothetical protein